MKEKVSAELKNSFRPEFLNRIDATVVFRSLTVEEIREIVDIQLQRVRDQLKAQSMSLEVTAGREGPAHQARLGSGVRRAAAAARDPEPRSRTCSPSTSCSAATRPGTTIEVDANADDGLVIQAAEQKTPVEVS